MCYPYILAESVVKMKKAKNKSLNIGVFRYYSPLHYFPSVSDRWFGEGLGVRLFIVSVLLLVVGVGQEVHAQDVITKDTARWQAKQDSLLPDNFGQKVDRQVRPTYRVDTLCLIDRFFRRGMSRKSIQNIPKGKRPAPETYLKRTYIRRHLKNFKAGASCLVSKE